MECHQATDAAQVVDNEITTKVFAMHDSKEIDEKGFRKASKSLISLINREFEQSGHPETKVLRYYR